MYHVRTLNLQKKIANPEQFKLPATHVGVQEARSLANQVTLDRLTLMVSKDSAADMSEFLSREVKAYPCLVDELAVAFGSVS